MSEFKSKVYSLIARKTQIYHFTTRKESYQRGFTSL